ncbi:MFS general substrate transporter [Xylariaceae sp. FL0804]|nr:MFS general substrate transporter [Xylariaceae sp. FL0804]
MGIEKAEPSAVQAQDSAVTNMTAAPGEEASQDAKKPLSFYMSVVVLGLMSLISSWDATCLAIALPTISDQLDSTTLESFWANISFMLGVAVTQPVYVSASDVLGRRPPLYASMLLFAAGAVAFATARTMPALIGGRLVQGLGGGGLDVLEEVILADITTLRERPLWLGVCSVAIAAGTISGPVLGGVLAGWDWRWIGWVNLPVVGAAAALALAFLRLRPVPTPFREKVRRLDWVGMALFGVGATAMTLPLSWGDTLYPWSSWKTIVPFVVGIAVLGVFGWYEKSRRDLDAILPYRVFSSVTGNASLVTGFIHGLILYTTLQYFPLFFEAVFLKAPLEAAKTVLPVNIVVVVFSFLAPVVIELTRRYRVLLWVGWILTTVFSGLWYTIGQDASRAELYSFECLMGVGVGIIFTGTQIPMQASVTHVDDTGLAVGMLVIFRLFGGLIGLAISSTVFNSVFQSTIPPHSVLQGKGAAQAISLIPSLRTLSLPRQDMDRLIETYRVAFQAVWIIIIAFSGLGLVVSLFIKDLSLESEEFGRQALDTDKTPQTNT